MKRTIRENIKAPYSLHDMNIMEFDVRENDLIMKTQSGMVKVAEPCEQVYNQNKYWGYLTSNRKTQECIIEIYHMGMLNTALGSGAKMLKICVRVLVFFVARYFSQLS